ncbi:hypothetical protein FJT64_009260 [Amphibalanus amphitrite]|uniref:Uncharacterized protein n=1 Tax=Amphibalanus amphitrite TaxID=1232801 RepID=A0A6A4VGZ5_AMPAM|nr:hypothetical protein FJT64_009260 [Amphibalanus amphitrite]
MGTREAEIQLKLKQLKLEQLTQQLSQEKEEEALKQKHKLQAVQDEVEAARLEATLRKAAESGLAWERKDDFADEKITGKEDNLELNEPKVMCVGGDEKMAQPILEERFGREQDIVRAKLNTIFRHPSPTIRTLEQFYADVNSAVTVLDRLDFKGDLYSQENLRRLVDKLPSHSDVAALVTGEAPPAPERAR